jgi:two-component system, OmpR family, sensor kinase
VSLPIRVRLTAWYALLMAAIVVALGAFLVLQLRTDLRQAVDEKVEASSIRIERAYKDEGAEDFRDVALTVLPHEDGAAQLLDESGRVRLRHGSVAAGPPLAPADARAAALAGEPALFAARVGVDRERYSLRVSAFRDGGRRWVLVVAESLEDVEEEVRRVLVLLLLAGPAALAATALGGYWLARKALRPVDRMTSNARAIGIDRLHERITVPRSADEIGQLAVTLNAMLDRLEHGVKQKRRLIADASHELRTPLAVMRAELDVSLRGDEMSADARGVLESVREEVDRMSRTVDNLLTLAQVDEGRLELLTAQVDLAEALDAAARPLLPLAVAKGVALQVEGDGLTAKADPQRLNQALTNLIENAIKFTPAGGEVRVSAWRAGGEVGVTVADDGPGVPPEAREHLFDRFYRVDSARRRDVGGSGLGLAICREIAVAHGGHVWVESEEGRGSAFSLALPADRALTPA